MLNDRSDGIEPYSRLEFVVDNSLISRFFPLLQKGVVIRSRIGCSIATFLKEEIGATPETIEKIQSVILDGKPVDDLETTYIQDGATLALSAAMPGLVGATLRRGGAYSSFRNAITHHETCGVSAQGEGSVQVKLFNLLMSDLGPDLLRRGVILCTRDIISFTSVQSSDFWEGCREITLDGKHIEGLKMRNADWPSGKEHVFLIATKR